ncbi:MAG: hypothetical protein Q8R59_04110 [Polaromonas sp.]|nr:hypothetical protein [Polaromonas sp.]
MAKAFPLQGNLPALPATHPGGTQRRLTRLWRIALVGLTTPLLFGCGMLAKNYLPDELLTNNFAKSTAPYVTKDGMVDLSGVNLAVYYSDKTGRAGLVATLVTMSDRKCEAHKATIMSNANNWNVASGTATILFAGYASVASSAHAAANAAAAAAATTGIQGQFNQEVYQGKLSTAILRAIDVARTKAYAKVTAGLGTAGYPTVQLVGDISKYHASCSLMAGVTELTSAIDNRRKSRAEIDANIVRLTAEIDKGKEAKYGASTLSALEAERQKQVMELVRATE